MTAPIAPAPEQPAPTKPVLQVRDVRMQFGGVVALDGVSFDLQKGSVLGLIGPNGSGKTTLVNVVSGMFHATAGTVLLNDVPITDLPPYRIARMGLARTFQITRPFARLSVLENVAVGAMFGRRGVQPGAHEAKAIAASVLERVGLASRADAPAAGLGIMDRKRLELARALAAEPEVLMLDEVLAGLRAAELDEAIDLVRTINRDGTTLIVIEHVLRVILSLCQQVIVLNQGRVIAQGDPEAVMRDPAVVTAYLGARAAGGFPHADA